MSNLFSSLQLGPYALPNRIVMAPMTRCRADANTVPTPIMIEYYRQRSSAGLIITEATQVSRQGIGYPNTPGIHDGRQVEGWKPITGAVHEAGGRIFLQLWHCGRISHSLFQDDGTLPVAPSAVAPAGEHLTPAGMKPFETPRALEIDEIAGVVDNYRRGAQSALEAGFDGVEIHGANGYLPDQFLRDGSNHRTDAYGGPVENRARFLLEVTQAAVDVWGPERVGVRLSPSATFNDMRDSDPLATFGYAISALDKLGIVYLHLVEGTEADERHGGSIVLTSEFRPLFERALIVNSGYDLARGNAVIGAGEADLVSFAQLFLANPDLPARLAANGPFNEPDFETFYGGGEKGYSDYPALAES
ncbi:MAG: alkene reductase [Thermoanaerobaculia bacterium]